MNADHRQLSVLDNRNARNERDGSDRLTADWFS